MLRALGRAFAVLLAFAAMVLFAALLSRATLQPSQAAESLTHTNLRPGASIRDYLEQPEVFAPSSSSWAGTSSCWEHPSVSCCRSWHRSCAAS